MTVAFRWISLSVALSLVATSLRTDGAPLSPVESKAEQKLIWPFVPPADRDPCRIATSSSSPIPYNVVQACLDANFPFPADNRAKTAESIKKTIQGGYVFEDLAANPPEDSSFSLQPARVVEEVGALAAQTGLTARAFHDGISKAFARARDAHLGYHATCFRQFRFKHGFIMGSDTDPDTGKTSLVVKAVLSDFPKLSSLNFNPGNCEVVTINGTPAMDYIQAWADEEVEISKDANVRYNNAIGNPIFKADANGYLTYGAFSYRKTLPSEASLKYGFRCPHLWGEEQVKDVEVKWGAHYEGDRGILTVPQYYQAYCTEGTASNSASPSDPESKDPTSIQQSQDGETVNEHLAKSEKELVDQVLSTPWDDLPEQVRQWAIDKVVGEFKAMPEWLAQRTQEIILGPEEVSRSKIEWTDEAHNETLREHAERILRAMPVFEPVPELPIFTQKQPVERISALSNFNAAAGGFKVLLDGGEGFYAILLSDQKTGVLTIPTFMPSSRSLLGLTSYFANFLQAIDVLRPVAEHLIIDVTRNGGGATCLSQRFVETFFPGIQPPVTNIRYSPVEAQLIDINYGHYDNYYTSATLDPVTIEYLKQTVSHPNREFSFTNYFSESCTSLPFGELQVDPEAEAKRPRAITKGYVYDPNQPYYPWDPEDILILSDGTCGSACATFSNQLSQKRGVVTVAVGGKPDDEAMSFSSFPGGQVLQAKDQYFTKWQVLHNTLNQASGGDDDDLDHRKENVKKEEQQEQQQQHEEVQKQENQSEGLLEKRDDVTAEAGSVPGQVDETTAATTMTITAQSETRFTKSATITIEQRDNLLLVLPEPLQHKATLSFTYRQTYNTDTVRNQFIQDENGEWVPNWGPNIAQWTEYTFLPATHRILYEDKHYEAAHRLWEDARNIVWGN
ncbi:hypothetical protein BGW42_004438 [Actinomortierella wolfii]|nr:hypothetical protein BGW42_004438 [Actinomortierella wolfii]